MKPRTRGTILAVAVGIAGAGCNSTSYDSAYYDPYVYSSYTPAEVHYSSTYWADPNYLYFINGPYGGSGDGNPPLTPAGAEAGVAMVGDGGTGTSAATGTVASGAVRPGTSALLSFGDVIRALARGEDVCPGEVTATPRMAPSPCAAGGTAVVRAGVELVFAGCQLPNGGTLDGNIDVQTTRTASDATCTSTTTITLVHTATVTNLTFTGPSGRRLVIPHQTGTGMTTYVLGQRPAAAATTIDGRLQLFSVDGGLIADRNYAGDFTVTPSPQDQSAFTVDAALLLDDVDGSGSTTLSAAGLTRSSGCCLPTGGTVSATRTGQRAFARHVWSFNTACGTATFDGNTVLLGDCL